MKLQQVMSIFGLTQHINSPTHRDGHTLDVLITRSDVVMQSVRVDPPLLSDHSAVIAIFDLPFKQDPSVARCVRRCWRSFDVDVFMHDIDQSSLIQSPPSDVVDLFASYDTTLRSILDKHAPYKALQLRAKASSAVWYDGACRAEKTKTRRLEKVYRLTPNPVSLAEWRKQFAHQRTVFERRFVAH